MLSHAQDQARKTEYEEYEAEGLQEQVFLKLRKKWPDLWLPEVGGLERELDEVS